MPPKQQANTAGSKTGSPTLIDQQQQQLFQQRLRAFRLSQQRSVQLSKGELVKTAIPFLFAICSFHYVCMEYGWLHMMVWAMLMWLGGFLKFITVIGRYIISTQEGASFTDALRRADTMTSPILEKTTLQDENAMLAYGFSCMQGWRRSMEDDHTLLLLDDGGFFGVYDGHNGPATAKFCGENMYEFVSKTAAFKEGNVTTALYDGFISVDKHLHSGHIHERSGCTAVVLYVRDDDLFCANAGDSRCVLCRDGEPFPLTVDHKPFLPAEQTRIERAGGYVWNRRVNGVLALSRAIGDFGFKSNAQVSWDQQAVTSAPEVRTTRLNRDKDEFAVIACDGIWDVLSNEEVIEFVRQRIQQRVPLGTIAEQLMNSCLSHQPFGVGCDNMSVILVQFKRPQHGQSIAPSSTTTTATASAARVSS